MFRLAGLALFIVVAIWLVVAAPQLIVLALIGGGWLARRRAKAHRFDTFVTEMLKDR